VLVTTLTEEELNKLTIQSKNSQAVKEVCGPQEDHCEKDVKSTKKWL